MMPARVRKGRDAGRREVLSPFLSLSNRRREGERKKDRERGRNRGRERGREGGSEVFSPKDVDNVNLF